MISDATEEARQGSGVCEALTADPLSTQSPAPCSGRRINHHSQSPRAPLQPPLPWDDELIQLEQC